VAAETIRKSHCLLMRLRNSLGDGGQQESLIMSPYSVVRFYANTIVLVSNSIELVVQ
jgi:hypothetical protein